MRCSLTTSDNLKHHDSCLLETKLTMLLVYNGSAEWMGSSWLWIRPLLLSPVLHLTFQTEAFHCTNPSKFPNTIIDSQDRKVRPPTTHFPVQFFTLTDTCSYLSNGFYVQTFSVAYYERWARLGEVCTFPCLQAKRLSLSLGPFDRECAIHSCTALHSVLWSHSADLSEAVDVYSDWIDACEQANA